MPALILLLLVSACSGNIRTNAPEAAPTVMDVFSGSLTAPNAAEIGSEAQTTAATEGSSDNEIEAEEGSSFTVRVDVTAPAGEISPLIYGLSGGGPETQAALRPTFISWGGNPSSRYNWRLGNAWNSGSDYYYRNTDYGFKLDENGLSLSDSMMAEAQAARRAVRLAVPTLGWVANNSEPQTCSFPMANGECGTANWANCKTRNGQIADPNLTSVVSTPADIRDWMDHLMVQGHTPRFIAFDNEPELWGYTHYDVHPDCTTYQEILDQYLAYAPAVQEVVPDAELTGPVTCCWEFYWHSASGSADERKHGNQPFLPWFLAQMRSYEEEEGQRILHVLDIHYYPEGVFNNLSDPETAAQRLRSTRSLWDASYVDESYIGEPIRLIPRMLAEINTHYPGTRLGISEWNWGADTTMNGALAIADVLGIFGREGLYFAAYWQFPPPESPGALAFQMYSNYDNQGSRFEGTVLPVRRTDAEAVGAYAAWDENSGMVRLMLINRQPAKAEAVQVLFDGFSAAAATLYRYDQAVPDGITSSEAVVANGAVLLELPAYSISLLEISGEE